jgi:hypothetical protein
MTLMCAVACPPAPLQDREYIEFWVTTTLLEPEVASAPLQAPDAVHEVAFVEDQVSVTDPSAATPVEELEMLAVGGGAVELLSPPPPPHPANKHNATSPRLCLLCSRTMRHSLRCLVFFHQHTSSLLNVRLREVAWPD